MQPLTAIQGGPRPGIPCPGRSHKVQQVTEAFQSCVDFIHGQHEIVPGGKGRLGLDDVGHLLAAFGNQPVEGG